MCKLCLELISQPSARIKISGNPNVYRLLAFSYMNRSDINMTLQTSDNKTFICTRKRYEITCIDCIHQH